VARTRSQSGGKPPRGALASRLRWLHEPGNAALVRRGLRGVEKESLRVDARGRLSNRPHPRALGAALTHPNLTTDYSESLPEFVTEPQHSNWETLQLLCDLHVFAHQRLDGELLWPGSMPCVLDADHEIPIAYYGTSNPGLLKTIYRRGLGYRYGRAMQAIAGVHFNYSPPVSLWPAYREHEARSESSSTASGGSSTRTSSRSRTSTTARFGRSRASRRITGRSALCASPASSTSRSARST